MEASQAGRPLALLRCSGPCDCASVPRTSRGIPTSSPHLLRQRRCCLAAPHATGSARTNGAKRGPWAAAPKAPDGPRATLMCPSLQHRLTPASVRTTKTYRGLQLLCGWPCAHRSALDCRSAAIHKARQPKIGTSIPPSVSGDRVPGAQSTSRCAPVPQAERRAGRLRCSSKLPAIAA